VCVCVCVIVWSSALVTLCTCNGIDGRCPTKKTNYLENVFSIHCINKNFIHVCDNNKCTFKSICNVHCFLFSPTCFGHTLTVFRAYVLVPRVCIKMCSSPYNFVLKRIKLVHFFDQNRFTKGCRIQHSFDMEIFETFKLLVDLSWTNLGRFNTETTTRFKMYSCHWDAIPDDGQRVTETSRRE
jgi:hypothetical protein